MKGGESGGKTGMSEVLSDGDEGSRVLSLSPAVKVWMTSHAVSSRNVNSNGSDVGEFPWQII